jgi:hypothetical protein
MLSIGHPLRRKCLRVTGSCAPSVTGIFVFRGWAPCVALVDATRQVVVPRSSEASVTAALDPAGKGVIDYTEFLGVAMSSTPIVAPPSMHDVCMRVCTVFNAWALVRKQSDDAPTFLRALARFARRHLSLAFLFPYR